jgi:hypothetical protein
MIVYHGYMPQALIIREYTFANFSGKFFQNKKNVILKELKSECECRRTEKINLKQTDSYTEIDIQNTDINYDVENGYLENITCDLYNVLRRGKKQKVIGFSLYGKNKLYYRFLNDISKRVQQMYPGWIIRVHHDSSIDQETKCELECLRDVKGNFIDNVDFCNVEYMPSNQNVDTKLASLGISVMDYGSQPWNASYIHAMVNNLLIIALKLLNQFIF